MNEKKLKTIRAAQRFNLAVTVLIKLDDRLLLHGRLADLFAFCALFDLTVKPENPADPLTVYTGRGEFCGVLDLAVSTLCLWYDKLEFDFKLEKINS